MKVLRVYHGGRDAAHRARDRALVAAGVELTTVVPAHWSEGGAEQVLSPEAWPVRELEVVRSGDVNRHRYARPEDLSAVLGDVRPDVVDLHEEPFAAVTRQWLAVIPRHVPVVSYTAQNIDKRWPPPFAQWETRALRRLAGIYPCSRQAASVVRGKGFTGEIAVLPLGIDPALMHPGDQRHDDTEWTLVLVGRLVPEKGVREAVEVLRRVQQHKPARLVVVGRGPEGEAIADQPDVEVRPWATAAEVADLYRQAHVALLPSRATRTWVEQFGRVITEGQACGAVVCGWASGSIPEVGAGLAPLAAEDDVAGLAERVVELVRDRDAWEALRDKGIRRARGITWDAVAAQQLAFYERAAKRPHVADTGRPAAVREFGEPAQVAGGGRPFALPVLREDKPWTRALGRALDVTNGTFRH